MKPRTIAEKIAAQRKARQGTGGDAPAAPASAPRGPNVDRLREAVVKRERVLASAELRLGGAQRRGDAAAAAEAVAKSKERLADAKAALAAALARAKRHEAQVRAAARVAAGIEAKGPATAERWAKDRRRERTRIKALKAAIARRLRDDRPAAVKTPPLLSEEELSRPIAHRFRPFTQEEIDAGRVRLAEIAELGAMTSADPLPPWWTPEHVAERMLEAFETLARLPMRVRPAAGGNGWPAYLHEFGDLAAQSAMAEVERDRNRVSLGVSLTEMRRMDQALSWPLDHLAGDPDAARAVSMWAARTAGKKRTAFVRRAFRGMAMRSIWRLRAEGLARIAAALNSAGVPVE